MRGLLALVLLGGVLAVGAAPGARNSSALTSSAGTRAERINFCLDGWDNFRGDCFYLENNPASWGTAERLCAEREGSLASAHSALEYHYLQRLAQKGGHTFAWLGGYHFLGEWRWEGGSPFDYVNTESDVSPSENQCLLINTEGNKGWSNHRCNNFFPYICGSGDVLDSQKTQARHYKTLQEICRSKKPNKASVTHLLNLEFESRRLFITSDTLKEQDRPSKILEAYSCFKDLDHVLDELQRILQPNNAHYVSEMRNRWKDFYSKVQFYGAIKKVIKPPKTLDGVEHATAVFRALPLLFPSSTLPPKKLGESSEAVFHVLTASEDPDAYLSKRPLSCPVLLVCEDNCMIAIGNTPVTTFDTKKVDEGLLYLLGASQQGEELRYPSKHEVTAMAKRLVEYYPMLQDKDEPIKHMSMYSYLQKRILNVKSPQKRKGPRPERSSSTKRRHIDFSPSDQGEDYDADSSGGSTILLPPRGSSEDDSSDAVCQILDLEFQSRRAFIDSGILKEEDRPAKIFEAYPCFKELHHVMDELRRILAKDNSKFINEVKKRWADFCSMVQFYGVWRKVLKPPMSLGAVESNIALFRALPTLFPSPSAPPKKMGQASEALLHVLQPTEEPAIYLQKRTLFSPVLVFDGSRCLLAIGNTPVTTFAKEELDTVREKFPNTMVSEIRALLRRKCNNEGYTKVAPQ
ncbi:unnamed protein product [Gadus morhua 'NCC']